MHRVIWKNKRNRSQLESQIRESRRRTLAPEQLEVRRLLAADPIHVGVVYIETDYLETDQDVGSDSRGDRFILSFTGGAADTELSEIRIRTDKDGDGITVGDPIYDTAVGGRGKNGAHGFQIVRVSTDGNRTVNASAAVDDGGQELVLTLDGFRAGDRIEFTLDVDEVLRNSADLAIFNDRLDVITSGQEFQDSILEATFNAPHYETSHADAIFINDFGDPASTLGIDIPPDEGTDVDSRPNRSAAAVASTNQIPKPISIAGQVWVDNNLNSQRDTSEQPLSDVEIALWQYDSASNRYTDTGHRAKTDANGQYVFSRALGLAPGKYRVVETQPDGLFSVAAIPGTVAGQSTGSAESSDVLTDINIPLGDTEAIRFDFAEAAPASLSGYVYRDDSNDGRRDTGETGIAGVRVQLVPINTIAPQSIVTVSTAADGSYHFTGLAPGTYEAIEVDQPSFLDDGIDTAGTVGGRTVGNPDQPGDAIRNIVLAGADEGIEYNFGETPFGSIAGYVYLIGPGQDCTGDHDAPGNEALPGVDVVLQDANGNTVATTKTDTQGRYFFGDIPIGNYRIIETTPTGLLDGMSHVGSIDGLTLGVASGGGAITEIVMTAGGSGVEYNFCEIAPATLSGYVYEDRSDDGRRDAGEQPIPGTTITLVNETGQTVATALTDAAGRYEFRDLVPGVYRILETQPTGFYDGKDSPGTIRGNTVGRLGSDTDSIIEIDLKQGDEAIEFNFGELLGASLSGRVHVDANGNCEFDPGEVTPEGVTITLLDSSGNQVATTTTDTSGQYRFTNIRPGQYTVVEGEVAGYFEGDAQAGSAGGVVESSNRVGAITLTSGEVAVDYDFCERPPAEIRGVVFSDRNGDCLIDDDEMGIENVVVELYNDAGTLVATTRTAADGSYAFTNLPQGSYTLREIQPAGYLQGGQMAGSAGGDTSIVDNISAIPIGFGDRLTQYNFCEVEPGSISGVVYVDADGDCVRDDDERPLSGVTIELRDGSGTKIGETQTNADGRYSFDGLSPGDYEIVEIQPEGFFQGGQTLGDGGGRVVGDDHLALTLTAGSDVTEYNFCEIDPGSISGTVYLDSDGDCERDEDEDPIEGVTIELRDASGNKVRTTTTDVNGKYTFENLEPGEYQIFEQQPEGFFQGGQTVGTGGGEILGPDLLGATLLAGRNITDYDFCEIEPGSISGIVYVDTDGDCERDDDEAPLEGVTIELRDASGNKVRTTTTDANGKYTFDNLEPGEYQIFEQQPDGFYQGGQKTGTGGGQVLGPDLLGTTLLAGADITGYDFCELPPGSISGFVHVDDDGDCEFDPDEAPLSNVVIELRDDNDRLIATTTTNASGKYTFGDLAPGRYHIIETQPEGYFQGGQTLGDGGGEIGGPDHLIVDLVAGTDLNHYDFCELEPSSISGSVWRETDLNQSQDDGESPIAGVLIELVNENGDVVSQTRTNGNGDYRFNDLAPGVYSVREYQPSGLFHGGQVVGSEGGTVGEDDLLVGITLSGGTHAVDYDFPEVPPAMISGHVFQDGGAIVTSTPLNPEDLRDFRDGKLTEDDELLSGVTLQLRNVLGQPFDSSRALPGVYSDGAIEVTTDADGYYEFTGLRPGTYHVYQVQPDDFIDGLDTAGTAGGLAVNPADVIDEEGKITIQTLSLSEETNPHDDAILNISLSAGSASQQNNFSEYTTEEPIQWVPPVPEKDPDLPVPITPIETFLTQDRVIVMGDIEPVRAPMIADDEWAVSWHLSVINGGFPGGKEGSEEGVIRSVSFKSGVENFTEGEHTGGRWVIVNSDGDLMSISDRLTLGDEDAIPLTGDFDGDGADEAAIYVGGNWFIDLNGDGTWDKGDLWVKLGTELDRPVVGDWDGDGKDDIGIFGRQWQRDPQRIKKDPGLPDPENKRRRRMTADQLARYKEDRGEDRERYLKKGEQGELRADAVDHVFQYGEQVDTPIAGDWNGDGIDQIAVFRSGKWMLDADGDGRWTKADDRASFGRPGDEPIVGDFNGDEIDEIGVVRGETWIIDTDGDRKITGNDLRIEVPRGGDSSRPVVGDFDGDGKDEPGYYDEEAA